MKKLKLSFPLPARLLAAVFGSYFLSPYLPESVKSSLYAVSLSLTEALTFILPVIIFTLIFSSIRKLKGQVHGILAYLLILVVVSNFLALWIAYFSGKALEPWLFSGGVSSVPTDAEGLSPAWNIKLPRIVSNDIALLFSIIMGIVTSKYDSSFWSKLEVNLQKTTHIILSRIFTPLVPVLVAGFILKFENDGLIVQIVKEYGPVVGAAMGVVLVYTTIIGLFLSRMDVRKLLGWMKNLIPAWITGASTMSSAAAVPLSIQAAEKNLGDEKLAGVIIPSTVNIHLLGDGILAPFLIFSLMKSFGMEIPDAATFLQFAIPAVLVKFSIAAVPGGGIFVLLPLLETKLGFQPQMLSMITAIYILMDSINAGANVFGNGIFAIFIAKTFPKKSRKDVPAATTEELAHQPGLSAAAASASVKPSPARG